MEPMADGIEVGGFPIPSRHQGDGQPARHHARRGGVASARGVHSRRAVCGLAHGDEGGGGVGESGQGIGEPEGDEINRALFLQVRQLPAKMQSGN